MSRSIKARLLLWMIGGMAVLLLLFGIVIYEVMRRSLVEGFDAVLASTARAIHALIESDRQGIKIEIDERESPEFFRAANLDYFQVWGEDGTTLERSVSLNGRELERFQGQPGSFVYRFVRLPDGRAGRAVSLFSELKADEHLGRAVPQRRVLLTVARETAVLDSEIRFLKWLLGAATGGTIVLALFVGVVVVRQGLKPLDILAARISAIRQDGLSVQIPIERMPAEMVPVVLRLNDLLQRLGVAFDRERAFTADVAHELRTPLAGLRSTLEVALTRPRTDADYRQVLKECLDITRHTQAMTDNLLALARLDGSEVTLHPEIISLGECIANAWQPLADKARSRRIILESRLPENLACTADRELLRMTLSILLTNAAEYTNDNGRIELRNAQAGKFVELTISNTGCRLSEEDVRHVFERFWRGDASRADTGIHCGLGLALAQRIVTSLGGLITASSAGSIFTVRLILPEAPQNQTPIGIPLRPRGAAEVTPYPKVGSG